MSDLGGTFDSDTVDPAAPIVPLPVGWYAMRIKASEIKVSKQNEKNRYLQCDLEIDENYHPELKGRMCWARLNLWNSNTQASDIAQRELSAICRAVGVPKVQDSEQLHGRTMAVRIAYRPAKDNFGEGNEVKGFAPLADHFTATGAAKAPAAAGAAPTAPAAPAPAAAFGGAPQAAPQAPQAAPQAPQPAEAAAPGPVVPAAPSGAEPAPWSK